MKNEWPITCSLTPISLCLCNILLISFTLYTFFWIHSVIYDCEYKQQLAESNLIKGTKEINERKTHSSKANAVEGSCDSGELDSKGWTQNRWTHELMEDTYLPSLRSREQSWDVLCPEKWNICYVLRWQSSRCQKSCSWKITLKYKTISLIKHQLLNMCEYL